MRWGCGRFLNSDKATMLINNTDSKSTEWLRGDILCTYSGTHHLAWSVPMDGARGRAVVVCAHRAYRSARCRSHVLHSRRRRALVHDVCAVFCPQGQHVDPGSVLVVRRGATPAVSLLLLLLLLLLLPCWSMASCVCQLQADGSFHDDVSDREPPGTGVDMVLCVDCADWKCVRCRAGACDSTS